MKEYDDVPVLQQVAKEGKLYGVLCEWRVYDVGNPKGYRFAKRVIRDINYSSFALKN